jgi:hypothetical protein
MFGMIIEGSDGGFNDEDHLLFLSSREDKDYWRNQEALAQLRYGHPEETLTILSEEGTPNADYAVAAALMTGNKEAFEKWLPRSNAPTGIHLLSQETHDSDHPLIDIHNALQAPDKTNWEEFFTQVPPEYKDLAVEAYGQAYILAQQEAKKEQERQKTEQNATPQESIKDSVRPEEQREEDETSAIENPSWFEKELLNTEYRSLPNPQACTTLSVGVARKDPILINEAKQLLDQQEFFFTQISIGAHVFCRSMLFTEAEKRTSAPEDKVQWLLYDAHALLGQHMIAKAQKRLKQAEAYPQNPEQTIRTLYLRARAREMASDTAGMEKYARKGLETKSPVFQSLMGKASLLKGKKTDSIWLLHKEGSNLNLPPDLLLEYSDLCAIAKRFGGNAIKVKINNEEVAYGKWERSKEFRAWFSEYLQKITTLAPSGSPPLPILLNNQRVEQNGHFLMRAVVAEFTDPLQISIRSMLKFNYHTIRGNTEKSDAWKEFKKTRIWLSQLPFPQLLHTHPELFQIKLGAL